PRSRPFSHPHLRGADQLLDLVTPELGLAADPDLADVDVPGPPDRTPAVQGTARAPEQVAHLLFRQEWLWHGPPSTGRRRFSICSLAASNCSSPFWCTA